MKFLDLTGKRFGRLTVEERSANHGRHVCWRCRCDCGNYKIASSTNLISGATSSCGCFHTSRVSTHQMSDSPEYHAWVSMKSRCYSVGNVGYKFYGGRGITVCDRWKNSFENFYGDLGGKPSANHSLDRIDPNGNYCPENCRWADRTTQDNNRRDSAFIAFDGKTLTIAQWAKETGISKSTIAGRIQYGWPIEDALTVIPDRTRRNKRHD